MNRVVVVLAVALGGLIVGAAKADMAQYQLSQPLLDFIADTPDSQDLAVGEGKTAFTVKGQSVQVTFSAHGTPADASGSVVYHLDLPDATVDEHGKVDCLAVSGNRAAISGSFENPVVGPSGEEGRYFILAVEDNGEPSATNPIPDFVDPGFGFFQPVSCALFEPAAATPILQGNVVVMNRP